MPKVNRTQKQSARGAAAVTSAVPTKSVTTKTHNKRVDDDVDTQLVANQGTTSNNKLSRGQRKRLAKREQYLKREKMILSTLKVQKMEEQKNRIDGLDAIKEALEQTIKENRLKVQQQSKQGNESHDDDEAVVVKSNKAKKNIAQKEITHFNLVLQHPSFKSNPFATMQEHLRNTLDQEAKKQEVNAKIQRSDEVLKEKEKKEARKERIRDAKFEKCRKPRRRRMNY
mmetsp:Transcript_385/g.553  ORF Transcript_385/g.553 Transcript_385/m.553 type:complete len:227 (+) Transcript_385:149-829(+)